MATSYRPQDEALFPTNWVVGQAAAGLVRKDEGVLLADGGPPTDPDRDLDRDLEEVAAPADGSRRPGADELAGLHAEMVRLQKRFAAGHERRQLFRHRAGVAVPAVDAGVTVAGGDRAVAPVRPAGRTGWWIVGLLLGAAVLLAAWLATGRGWPLSP